MTAENMTLSMVGLVIVIGGVAVSVAQRLPFGLSALYAAGERGWAMLASHCAWMHCTGLRCRCCRSKHAHRRAERRASMSNRLGFDMNSRAAA